MCPRCTAAASFFSRSGENGERGHRRNGDGASLVGRGSRTFDRFSQGQRFIWADRERGRIARRAAIGPAHVKSFYRRPERLTNLLCPTNFAPATSWDQRLGARVGLVHDRSRKTVGVA